MVQHRLQIRSKAKLWRQCLHNFRVDEIELSETVEFTPIANRLRWATLCLAEWATIQTLRIANRLRWATLPLDILTIRSLLRIANRLRWATLTCFKNANPY